MLSIISVNQFLHRLHSPLLKLCSSSLWVRIIPLSIYQYSKLSSTCVTYHLCVLYYPDWNEHTTVNTTKKTTINKIVRKGVRYIHVKYKFDVGNKYDIYIYI